MDYLSKLFLDVLHGNCGLKKRFVAARCAALEHKIARRITPVPENPSRQPRVMRAHPNFHIRDVSHH